MSMPRLISDRKEYSLQSLIEAIAIEFKLTDSERQSVLSFAPPGLIHFTTNPGQRAPKNAPARPGLQSFAASRLGSFKLAVRVVHQLALSLACFVLGSVGTEIFRDPDVVVPESSRWL